MHDWQTILNQLTPAKRALLAARNPLSFAQQRLWFLDQLAPGQADYNIPAALRLTGRLNVPALEAGINEIVRRHDALRTVFGAVEGRPFQLALPAKLVSLPLHDLRNVPETERETRLACLLNEAAGRPFDLTRGPLFSVELWRLAETEHVLWLNWHHIIADGWSLEIFFRELAMLYQAYLHGAPSPLPELPLQYGDYARWQRQEEQGEAWQRQLLYWKRQLQGAPASLPLPTEGTFRAQPSSAGATYRFTLPERLTAALRELSQRENVTLFMTLLAAFQTLLYRHTGETDLVVGTPQTNRNRVELEGLIGFFLNTLVLRGDLAGKPTTRELLARTRETVLAAHAHQDLPFEALVGELQPTRQLQQQPLFQVAFTWKSAVLPAAELPGLTVSALPLGSHTAKFDLSLGWVETAAGLEGVFEYRAALFAEGAIQRWAERLQRLLLGMTAQPAAPVSRLPLLTEAEQRQVIQEFNPEATPLSETLCVPALIEIRAARQPAKLAVVASDDALTYEQLNARANQLARRLQRLGIGPEMRVGICLERSAALVTAMLATLKAGGAYVPLDPAYPSERLRWLAENAGAGVLLTQRNLRERWGALRAPIVCLDEENNDDDREADQSLPNSVTQANAAYLIYTSGSTGQPKGVVVTHAGLLNLICWHQRAFGVTEADRVTQLAGVGFDACVWELWPHLAAGATLFLPDDETRLSPLMMRDWLVAQEITLAFLPTPLAEMVLSLAWPATTRLRCLLTGGDRLQSHPPPGLPFTLVNNYGPTECTVVASSGALAPARETTAPDIGRPIANTQVYLLDAALQPVPRGVVGEIFIGGVGLARGYHQQPALTAERFLPDPFSRAPGARLYRTGDLARHRADGALLFVGRADRQVKLRGIRVELGEIEAALKLHPAVKQAVAELRERMPHEPQLVAYLVPQNGALPSSEELRQFLQAKLPTALLPAAFVTLEKLPLTPNGKVDREALPPLETGFPHLAAKQPPRDRVEFELARLWEELLGSGPISAQDDFFARGGHSLLAVRLCAQIEKQFGQRLSLRTIFQMPVLAQLAAQLRRQANVALANSPLVALQSHGQRRPFFCVHPVGGSVWCYAALARRLGSEQPFYGLQARGLEPGEEPVARLDAMATAYLAALRKLQPHGPYLLGGWSLGGVIAFEMARQLSATGERIGLLAMFDSALPDSETRAADWDGDAGLWRSFAQQLGLSPDAAADPATILTQVKSAGVLPTATEGAELIRLFRVFKANVEALGDYAPRAYAGQVELWQAAERPPEIRRRQADRWRAYAAIQIHDIPGTHHTLLCEPQVAVLADVLGQRLAQVEQAQ